MKAAVCWEHGQPLRIEDIDIADPEGSEVRVKVAACAICHSDILYMDGAWGGDVPAVYGHEASGIVESVGPSVKSLRAGDRVLVTLIRHCGHCYYCDRGAQVLCPTTFPLDDKSPLTTPDGRPVAHGLRTGAFAEYVVVEESQTAKIGDDIPLDAASLLSCGVITGLGAVVNTAQVPPGSAVAVIGAGGVGLNAIQGAVLCGATPIIAVDLVEGKLESAKLFGATHTVNSREEDAAERVRALTQGHGVDFAFITVGVNAAIESGIDLIRRGGQVVIVGMPPEGVVSRYDPLSLTSFQQVIRGSKMGDTRLKLDIPKLLDYYRQGRLKLDELISGRFPPEQINEAVDEVRQGDVLRNVLIFDPDLR